MIPINGKQLGYRIGTTNRTIGDPTYVADDFLVLNQTSGMCFKAQGGVWVDGGTFPADLLAAWYGNDGIHLE